MIKTTNFTNIKDVKYKDIIYTLCGGWYQASILINNQWLTLAYAPTKKMAIEESKATLNNLRK